MRLHCLNCGKEYEMPIEVMKKIGYTQYSYCEECLHEAVKYLRKRTGGNTDEIEREARKEYMRRYRAQHRDRINQQEKIRKMKDPERYAEYQRKYWLEKAKEYEEEAK